MARNSAIPPPESFEEILAWLDADREVAAARYVQLRHDLANIFVSHGCIDAEELTDEVFDRVAGKAHEVRRTYIGDPRRYFLAVARNVVKEQLKRIKARVSLQDMRQVQQPMTDAEEREKLLTILDECLDELPPTEKQLLFAYYLPEKHDRQKLASHQGLSNMTLRVRVHRIRQKLKKAIERKMQIT